MTEVELEVLDSVQKRVLWLSMSMVQHANKVRQTTSGVKVGGHQASSASMVSIMTALYFKYLKSQDRVSVKPHAAPVLHAINYLMGRLDRAYLTELRAYHGLQSYPSRTKDPDPVDFSTGSVGVGATATIWSAFAQRYVTDHFERHQERGKHIALLGDAELDEGAIWEAALDPRVSQLGELLWIVDLNRQSLDRVLPDVATERFRPLFEAAGWNTITVKYGSGLRELFAKTDGMVLEERFDKMRNEEYQRLLRTPKQEVRERLVGSGPDAEKLKGLLRNYNDDMIYRLVRDLGGHDLQELLEAFRRADDVIDRPSVIFAYTIKAWRLPTQGHPGNHSALLTMEDWRQLADELGANADDPWAGFDSDSPEGKLCTSAADRLHRSERPIVPRVEVPRDFGRSHNSRTSTQQAFGRFFLDVAREAPQVAGRIVTVSADVATSTNLGGWINRVGIWNINDRYDWFADDRDSLVHWKESPKGQHIELGIAEVNLVGLIAELGATWSRDGEPLFPIGSIYDPFVGRALEPWSFGIYSGGQSILIGTPSGVTLAGEGGAHQSVITPSIGLEQPRCIAWEPAFGQDFEWALLAAISNLGFPDGVSSYFRLSTRPIDQSLAATPLDPVEREHRRLDVLAGGYRIRTAAGAPSVTLVGTGAVMPEVLAAAPVLLANGIDCDVICLTSADLFFRALQVRRGLGTGRSDILERVLPKDRSAPIVSVIDGHPHALAFLAGVNGTSMTCLGVSDFGQVGDVEDLYECYGIDVQTIVGAALDLCD